MNAWIRRAALRWLTREETVRVDECVHFGAWRYGAGAFNPYENYVCGLAQGTNREVLRAAFVEFLQYYRPADFGAALGVDLSRAYALWHYPWARRPPPPAWVADPASCPDILTHFSAAGILRSRIDEEFGWLETTFASIRQQGYQPQRHAGALQARCLLAADGRRRFLIHDGNHRLSAVVALGTTSVVVRYSPLASIREAEMARWRGVRGHVHAPADARAIFMAYFDGNSRWRIAANPAPILETAATAS